jgi:ATP-binding cassette, subfamily C (CFTR/MRP), member 1
VFVGPNVLHAMINYLRSPDDPMWHGIALAAIVTASQLAMSLCLRHYFFKCYTTGLRIRTAVVVAVYQKALQLSALERQRRTAGEITNLSSIDAQRLQGEQIFNRPRTMMFLLVRPSLIHSISFLRALFCFVGQT